MAQPLEPADLEPTDLVPADGWDAASAPVRVELWHVAPARPGETMSAELAQRLVAHFCRRPDLLIDLTAGEQLAYAARPPRHERPRAHATTDTPPLPLIVTAAPPGDGTGFFTDSAQILPPGARLVVVLAGIDVDVNRMLIGAAATAGLSYLRRIVASGSAGLHTDVLVFGALV
jgi:hypothetical protein